VILTAGKGTRLQPLTPRLSKAAIPLLNRPLIAYALDAVAALGIEEVAVVVGPDDRATARRAREHARGPLSIHVQKRPNGPGDAVASVGDLLSGRDVVVLVVDAVFTGLDPRPLEAFMASSADASLVLAPVPDPRSFGVAVLEGDRIVDLEEKPAAPRSNMAVVGIWMLAPEAVERVRTNPFINAKGESDLTATVGQMLREGAEVGGWLLEGEWLDAGTLPGLLHAQGRLLKDLAPTPVTARESDITGPVAAGQGCVVTMSHLAGPVMLGCDTRLDACDIADSVVGDGAVLQGVRLRRSRVMGGAQMQGGDYQDVVITAAGEVAGPGAL
jgi:glucose-1-phosphate thymidylyltransferase